ncbi:putative WRKY transcription factor 69 [Acorus gramineus]|uniref:WRKY transcription factor 69 n=1 Tax=Acorus gramineus TaxID=55184 RepID=A0AAV9BGA7_ACOGR|nr:putative WRKY transcription factor 69 [Acorus gramineus]
MDGRFMEEPSIPPPEMSPISDSSSKSKRSRRSVQKRVVSVPITETEGSRLKGGDGAPPSDSWAWRKYGQKPIKGSPYPRGYYRCSSSKGCPARKQVERSRLDPTTLVITYSSDHNHPWPTPRHKSSAPPPPPSPPPPPPPPSAAEDDDDKFSSPSSASADHPLTVDPDERFSAAMDDESSWFFSDGATASTFAAVGSPICFTDADVAVLLEEDGKFGEDDSMFAGLGELPECAVVFSRRCSVVR